jgi:glycosyltransferase involved in cell wall biosynthesis
VRIWHAYLVRGLHPVNGVVSVISRVAAEQAARGHDVTVVCAQPGPEPFPRALPPEVGCVLGPTVRAALARARARLEAAGRPDVVHFHEVLRPPHLVLARMVQPIPYVVSTHAGLFPENLARYRWKKAPYGALVERRFLRGAGAVIGTCPYEEEAIRRFVGRDGPPTASVPNPLDPALAALDPWSGPPEGPARLVTLSRYDVRHKGLDRLAAAARRLPDVTVEVFGRACQNEPRRLAALRRELPPNFHLRPAVYGADKHRVLRTATMFVLWSRWDAVSEAMAEAMSLGVPSAVSTFIGRTIPVAGEGLGLVLDDSPEAAIGQLRAALGDPARLRTWGAAGRRYAHTHFSPAVVAGALDEVYARVLAGAHR